MDQEKRFGSRGDILAADDTKIEEVHVPEWEMWVRVRTMSGDERDAFELGFADRRLQSQRNGTRAHDGRAAFRSIRARLVALTVIDEHNKPLFTESDVSLLGKKSAAALDRIFEVAQRLNRIGTKDIEELEKNSEPGLNDDSGSSSP